MRASPAAHLRLGGSGRAAMAVLATAAVPCAMLRRGGVATTLDAAGTARSGVPSALHAARRCTSSSVRPPRPPPSPPPSPPPPPAPHPPLFSCLYHGPSDAEEGATARAASSQTSLSHAHSYNAPRGRRRERGSHKGSPVRPKQAQQQPVALTPLTRQLCALVASGAWRDALELLNHAYLPATREAQHVVAETSQDRTASSLSPTSLSSSPVALDEVGAWLLLWGGHSSPVWRLWGTLQKNRTSTPSTTTTNTASSSNSSAARPALSSPLLLLLLLALFTRLVERDAVRTRDALLVFDLLQPSRADDGGGCAVAMQVGESRLRFLARWLSCCSDALDMSRRDVPANAAAEDLRAFVQEAVHRATVSVSSSSPSAASSASVGPHAVAGGVDAETVALLLLSLHDALGSCGGSPGGHQQLLRDALLALRRGESETSWDTQRGSAAVAEATVASTVAEILFQDAPPTSCDAITVASARMTMGCVGDSVNAPSAAAAATLTSEEYRAAVRRAFATASRLLQPHAHHWSTSTSAAGDAATTHLLMMCYRFWQSRFLGSDVELAPVWMALQAAVENGAATAPGIADPPPRGRGERDTSPRLPTPPPLRALLRRIERATDDGEWATALRLCLDDAGVSTPPTATRERVGCTAAAAAAAADAAAAAVSRYARSPAADPFPWRRRLRKGLAACEAARPAGAAWAGALSLWRFARAHMDDTDTAAGAPQRDLGRIFALLARATRWVEALACFHETPDRCLDGFVVAQVMYALRACPARHDRAVLDVWAAWRCRCGDAARPTADMTHQLLGAMLHASGTPPTLASLSSVSAAPPADVAAEVSTRLLTAATGPGAAAAVPLEWTRERHAVRQVVRDRWVAGWADALRVALASGDAELLVHTVAPRVPAAHPPSLYTEVARALRERGVSLTPADRVTLLALWTPGQPQHPSRPQRQHGDGEAAHAITRATSDADLAERERTRLKVLAAEAMLDDLLGLR